MHYEHFKQRDPRVLKALVRAFPLATITVNGAGAPVIAYAPLVFKQGAEANGVVEFHIARENPIMTYLHTGALLTIAVHGVSAPISPSWYSARFAGENPDRSKTAPTYNYVNATLSGALQLLDTEGLTRHIGELVAENEPHDGWKMQEIDPAVFSKWSGLIAGFRLHIASFEMVAKLSQEQNDADKPGIIRGLKKRGTASDIAMARLIERYDGTPDSLILALQNA